MIFANIVMIILYNKGVLGITELLNPQIGNNQVPDHTILSSVADVKLVYIPIQ